MTVTSIQAGSLRVDTHGKLIEVPLSAFEKDSELRDIAVQAIAFPGIPVTVPNTSYARGLRPRNSRVHGILL